MGHPALFKKKGYRMEARYKIYIIRSSENSIWENQKKILIATLFYI